MIIEYIILFNIYTYILFFIDNQKKLIDNPIIIGFPLYSLGALTIIYLHNKLKIKNILLQFILYAIVLTLFEYIVGKYIVNAGKIING